MHFDLRFSKAAISAVVVSLSILASTKLNNFGNGNNTNVICAPPVASQAQPKG